MGNEFGIKQQLFCCALVDVKIIIDSLIHRMCSIENMNSESCYAICKYVIDTINVQTHRYAYNIFICEKLIDVFRDLLDKQQNTNELSYKIVESVIYIETQLNCMLRLLYIDCEDWEPQFHNFYCKICQNKNELNRLLDDAFMRQLYND